MLLLTLVLFVVNWDRIRKTLVSSGFADAVKLPGPREPGNGAPGDAAPGKGDGSVEPPADSEPAPRASPKQPVSAADPTPSAQPAQGKDAPKPSDAATPTVTAPAPAPKTPPAAAPVEQVRSTRMATLYFVRVDDDGVISRHEVKRTVGASDSPMTDSLAALLAGPDADELSRGFISLVPAGTKLLSAQVRGSTAYLNFNEAFMYNRYGIEGYAGQLKQVVYTTTTFPNVKDVQILIEGKKVDYLGGDGVYIGKPLSRASF